MDAIRAGHSDHIVTVLKLWALGFCAMGRVKYAHELLHLVHNIIHIWPPALRYVFDLLPLFQALTQLHSDVIMKNWLVNTTGNPNSFVPVDLLQEHLNYWIKVIVLLSTMIYTI